MKIVCKILPPHLHSAQLIPVFFLLIWVSAGCRVLKPEKPVEAYNAASYTPQYSYINIPVVADVKTVKRLINREISGEIYADTSFEDHDRDDLKLRATLTDSIEIGMDRNQFTYRVPLKVWISKRFSAGILGYSYSDTRYATAEVALKFKTTVNINRDWTINTVTVSDGYEWISYPQMMVGLMQIPLPFISDLLLKSNLPVITREIDHAFKESLSPGSRMTDAWTRMQKPFLVSADNSLWMKLSPLEVSSVPIRAGNASLTHAVGLKALVQLYFGQEPDYAVNPILPPLKITSSIPDNFNINFSMDVPFSRINALARTQFNGYVFSYRNYKITVLDISIYGQGENLIVALAVEGSVKGTIYLSGVPVFDREKMTIGLSNLDFHIATQNALVKTASWVFHSGLIRKMSENLVFSFGDRLRDAREEVNSFLEHNRGLGYFRISGGVDKLEPDRILISPESVKAYFRFEGRMRVSLDPSGKL